MLYSEFIENPVRKFAKHGLDEAVDSSENQRKWLLNWSVGLATELDELLTAIENNEYYGIVLTELGDFIWYYSVQFLLFNREPDLPVDVYKIRSERSVTTLYGMRLALRRLDNVKKFSRDNAIIDDEKIDYLLKTAKEVCTTVFESFSLEEINLALELCFIKLNGRHGEKYDPEKSRARYE